MKTKESESELRKRVAMLEVALQLAVNDIEAGQVMRAYQRLSNTVNDPLLVKGTA